MGGQPHPRRRDSTGGDGVRAGKRREGGGVRLDSRDPPGAEPVREDAFRSRGRRDHARAVQVHVRRDRQDAERRAARGARARLSDPGHAATRRALRRSDAARTRRAGREARLDTRGGIGAVGGSDFRGRPRLRRRPGRRRARDRRPQRQGALVVPGGRSDPDASHGGGGRALRPGRRRLPLQARGGERGGALAGARRGQAGRAPALRRSQVALRPLRLRRDGRGRAALPGDARGTRAGARSREGRHRLGVRGG